MKYNDLVRTLQDAGWKISHGGSHDMAKHVDRPGCKIPIPRHKEIKETTAKEILKRAGLM